MYKICKGFNAYKGYKACMCCKCCMALWGTKDNSVLNGFPDSLGQ